MRGFLVRQIGWGPASFGYQVDETGGGPTPVFLLVPGLLLETELVPAVFLDTELLPPLLLDTELVPAVLLETEISGTT